MRKRVGDAVQGRFPHGAPFGVFFASLLEAVELGGVEELGREFGEPPVSANGAREGSQGLGELIRSTPITGEVAQAGMVWPPHDAASIWPAWKATDPASSGTH